MAETVDSAYLARFLMMTSRNVEKLAREEIIPREGRGKYDFVKCCQAYIKYLRHLGEGTDLSLTDERTRETRLKADILEMESAKLKGELVDKAVAVEVWQGLLGAFKSKLSSATVKMRPIINNIKTKTDKTEANEFLSTLHREALDELSGIQAADYTGDIGVLDDTETPAGHDDKRVGRRKKGSKSGINRRVRKVANKKG